MSFSRKIASYFPRPATTTSSAASAHPEDRAERRQVTVMFSDLVGSTALSARMDPEDLLRLRSLASRRLDTAKAARCYRCPAQRRERQDARDGARSFRPIRNASRRPWALRRLRREVHGRWGSDLLRVSARPRGRRRAGRARRAGVGRCCRCPEDPRAPTDPRRHRNGSGGRRRPDRLGRFPGASHRRRDAEPCGALAGHCGAEQRGDCGEHTEARGQPVRA